MTNETITARTGLAYGIYGDSYETILLKILDRMKGKEKRELPDGQAAN